MDRLLEGYRQFRASVWPEERSRYEAMARRGQTPETLVIACSDSRVDPATVFGAVPGELFSVRNVAGLVPRYQPDAGYHGTSAALEYGVRVLKVARIVVLGHAQCGGIRAMVEGAPQGARDFVKPWMKIAEPVLRAQPSGPDSADPLTFYENGVVRLTLANLMSFPWIAEAVISGGLALHGFRFDIHTGVLAVLEGDSFVPVASASG
ncbi:MAG: carbonic anhydrase [Alphaproteobacteria bacterium]|nr:carbonic anhydrase [Alphaproteobacteria bacterium]